MDLLNIAEIELTYKRHPNSANNPKISTSEDAYNVLIRNWNENKIDFLEEAKIILLSRSNRVLGISNISSGGVSCTVVDPRMVFGYSLKSKCLSHCFSPQSSIRKPPTKQYGQDND